MNGRLGPCPAERALSTSGRRRALVDGVGGAETPAGKQVARCHLDSGPKRSVPESCQGRLSSGWHASAHTRRCHVTPFICPCTEGCEHMWLRGQGKGRLGSVPLVCPSVQRGLWCSPYGVAVGTTGSAWHLEGSDRYKPHPLLHPSQGSFLEREDGEPEP